MSIFNSKKQISIPTRTPLRLSNLKLVPIFLNNKLSAFINLAGDEIGNMLIKHFRFRYSFAVVEIMIVILIIAFFAKNTWATKFMLFLIIVCSDMIYKRMRLISHNPHYFFPPRTS